MPSNPVLVCYDGSDDAKCALDRAAELFAGRSCVVLCVYEHGWTNLKVAWPSDEQLESLQAAASQGAATFADEGVALAVARGLTAEPVSRLARGPIWQLILSVADEYDAAAIVLGSRGHNAVKSLVLGSVSNAVANHSSRPVVIVPRGAAAATGDGAADLAGASAS
jgi:nucleotide-binding universal stress UspA family protein